MKIKNIKTIPVSLRLKTPFKIGNVTNEHMHYVITKIESDEGISGCSEAIPAWEVTGETQAGTISAIQLFRDDVLLGESLIGKKIGSLDDVRNLYNSIIEPVNGTQFVWGNPTAKCGLECALLDLAARAENVPIYKMLGGSNQEVVTPLVLGIYGVEETIEKALGGVEAGYKTVKLKVGAKKVDGLDNYQRDVEVVNRLNEELRRSDVRLVADANQGYVDADTSVRVIRQFQGLDWIEQPVLADDKIGLREVRRRVDVPVMADEAVHNYHDAKLLLELDAVDYVNIKLMKSSGILGALRIADLCAENNVPCQIGSMLESTLGTAMGITAYNCSENIRTNELVGIYLMNENLGRGVYVDGNKISLNGKPGFGVDITDEELERFRTKSNLSAGKTVESYR